MLEALVFDEDHVLDSRKLLRMQGYLDQHSFREIINEFDIALQQRLRNLGSDAASCSDVEQSCHDLMNLSGTLGMCELMTASERLRKKAQRTTPADLAIACLEVLKAGDRATAALRDYMRGYSG